jgi:fatty acid desaturase
MDADILIPITLFLCITYAIKALLDSRTRAKLIAANGTEDMIRSLVQNEEQQRRHTSLRWGVVLTALAVGFGLIEFFGWDDVTPGAIALLLGATGIGNLVFYSIARNLPQR